MLALFVAATYVSHDMPFSNQAASAEPGGLVCSGFGHQGATYSFHHAFHSS